LKRNAQTTAAQARATRLAERRRREEALFSAAADALATINRTVGSLDLAVDMANEKLLEASDQLQDAVRSLGEFGYRMAAVAAVLGVEPADLRPGPTLALRRSRLRPAGRPSQDNPDGDPLPPDDTDPGASPAGADPDCGSPNGRNPS
jgi:hypothetical protein